MLKVIQLSILGAIIYGFLSITVFVDPKDFKDKNATKNLANATRDLVEVVEDSLNNHEYIIRPRKTEINHIEANYMPTNYRVQNSKQQIDIQDIVVYDPSILISYINAIRATPHTCGSRKYEVVEPVWFSNALKNASYRQANANAKGQTYNNYSLEYSFDGYSYEPSMFDNKSYLESLVDYEKTTTKFKYAYADSFKGGIDKVRMADIVNNMVANDHVCTKIMDPSINAVGMGAIQSKTGITSMVLMFGKMNVNKSAVVKYVPKQKKHFNELDNEQTHLLLINELKHLRLTVKNMSNGTVGFPDMLMEENGLTEYASKELVKILNGKSKKIKLSDGVKKKYEYVTDMKIVSATIPAKNFAKTLYLLKETNVMLAGEYAKAFGLATYTDSKGNITFVLVSGDSDVI